MADIKEYPLQQKKYILSRNNANENYSKIRLDFVEQYGWVLTLKDNIFKYEFLTVDELKDIIRLLEQYNKS